MLARLQVEEPRAKLQRRNLDIPDNNPALMSHDDKVEECKKEKIVTATRKGAAVLDQNIPDHIKMTYHVLQVDDEIYDATMNQTNVGDNNNKFYIIQALGYDADKLPLGKLSKSTILKVEALDEIEIATKLLEDDSPIRGYTVDIVQIFKVSGHGEMERFHKVALGEMNELLNADYDANNLPKGKLSTKGVGQTAPNIEESKITDDIVVVPLEKPKEEPSKWGSLLYNEYIVYNVD
ncbi:hypothetical protein E2562_012822 [Oryza meyeriana var. granulata]|uniref:Poly [ADP-ribose] polymerase n=1 Tax=Oryza meyeriana var. granulata TaxID=110450 RepID=A0A6G1DHW4_9ORYZ|nr:hypothetical protein E2562_012822 [Oryza meyeriana var. granulata]